MTKFSYSDYLSQFRNVGAKRDNVQPASVGDGRRGDAPRDAASEPEDLDPVVCAVTRGDVDAVIGLSTSAPHTLLQENKDGWTPLHYAAYCGQAECLKVLLRAHPASADKRTLQEQTALLLAVSAQHLPCVQCLLEAGADPDIGSKNKETPLYKACELQNLPALGLLLAHGATVNQRCARGWTALHEAVARGDTAACDVLIGAGATLNPANTYCVAPLSVAARRGRAPALRYLLDRGADVNVQTCEGVTALHEACRNGHVDAAAALLSRNADANKATAAGLLPLHFAAQYGHDDIVSLLVPVTSRARLRHSGISPLHLAAEHDRRAAAAALLRSGADVDAALARGYAERYADRRATALYVAVAGGNAETAAVLLNAGASLSLDPVSPLLMAVRQGCGATVALMLEKGADANARLPSRPTTFPAAVALCTNDLRLLKCLLDNGCDASSCFGCAYGSGPHPPSGGSQIRTASSNRHVSENDSLLPFNCTESTDRATQFCEWISAPAMRPWAGPVIDLLLEHVAHVRLCSRLTELLDSHPDWTAVKRKSLSPRSLLHLCRLRIRGDVGRHRLKSLPTLPLPDRLIRYLSLTD